MKVKTEITTQDIVTVSIKELSLIAKCIYTDNYGERRGINAYQLEDLRAQEYSTSEANGIINDLFLEHGNQLIDSNFKNYIINFSSKEISFLEKCVTLDTTSNNIKWLVDKNKK